ncbi:MAG: SUMF1/EgtB/PvdO family nonheme iron enzyme [Cyanobacteria bacterium P01_E01_bin.6]
MASGKKPGQGGRKFALLIGVSEFGEGFKPLHTPPQAIAQFKEILTDPAIGGFPSDHVIDVLNPTVGDMQANIGEFFCNRRRKEDVLLFYFVGHGIKDEHGGFHFSTRQTRKFENGRLNSGTAVAASFILGQMSQSDSKRQVVILDCCFSGAFPDGALAMDDGAVNVKQQMGGQGRAVLTATTSTQYALEQDGEILSIYTRYLLEGLKTGAAAPENQEWIDAGHMHDYVRQKLETAAATMSPQLYAAREGRSIIIAKAPVGDPELRYRKLVQRHLRETGAISPVGRRRLTRQGKELGLASGRIIEIETEVCRPFQERHENLAEYEDAYREALNHEHPLSDFTRQELADYQRDLNLRDEDVQSIQAKLHQELHGVQGLDNAQALDSAQGLDSAADPSAPPSVVPSRSPSPSEQNRTFSYETVRVDETRVIVERIPQEAEYYTEDVGNGITFDMVKIPGGVFIMGSPKGEGTEDEQPQHQVTVPSFYMGKVVVTQAVYEAVIGSNPSHFKGDNRPVETVSWNDAIAFCRILSERTGNTYRLPSEAEWEYVCRANTTTTYSFGDAIAPELANYRESDLKQTSDVGRYPPNGFGVFDMHGNVWEWCLDHWHEHYKGAPADGNAWIDDGDKSLRLLRGGSWDSYPRNCRSAYRYYDNPDDRYSNLGFRVVCRAPRALR